MNGDPLRGTWVPFEMQKIHRNTERTSGIMHPGYVAVGQLFFKNVFFNLSVCFIDLLLHIYLFQMVAVGIDMIS